MAEITTSFLAFVPTMDASDGGPEFQILTPCGTEIGGIYYRELYREYTAEFYLRRRWSHNELTELGAFIQKLQTPLDPI